MRALRLASRCHVVRNLNPAATKRKILVENLIHTIPYFRVTSSNGLPFVNRPTLVKSTVFDEIFKYMINNDMYIRVYVCAHTHM